MIRDIDYDIFYEYYNINEKDKIMNNAKELLEKSIVLIMNMKKKIYC